VSNSVNLVYRLKPPSSSLPWIDRGASTVLTISLLSLSPLAVLSV